MYMNQREKQKFINEIRNKNKDINRWQRDYNILLNHYYETNNKNFKII